MMTVLELARKSGVSPHVVRYYTRLGLLRPLSNPQNGYRMFTEPDVARLKFIRKAQSLGFTLKEITQIFKESSRGESPCPNVRRIIERRIEENREALNELMKLQTRMEQALVRWSKMPDGVPDGNTVCHLIESATDNGKKA